MKTKNRIHYISLSLACWGGLAASQYALAQDAVMLQNGETLSNLSAPQNQQNFYTIEVPSGASGLVVASNGGTGDADMYLKFGSAPTTEDYDCRPWVNGNKETCTVDDVKAGTYHILINSYNTYEGMSLLASYTVGSGSTPPTPVPTLAPTPVPTVTPSMPPTAAVPDICGIGGQKGGADTKNLAIGDDNAWCIDGSRRLSDDAPLYRHFIVKLSDHGVDASAVGKFLRIRTGNGGADKSSYGDLSLYACFDCGVFPHENHFDDYKKGTWSPGDIYGGETAQSVAETVVIPIDAAEDINDTLLITVAPPKHLEGTDWKSDRDANGQYVDAIGVSIVADIIEHNHGGHGGGNHGGGNSGGGNNGGSTPPPLEYCAANGGGNYEYIDSVAIGSGSNASGEKGSDGDLDGYSDFTGDPLKTLHLFSGPQAFTLTPGFTDSSYTEHWAIWMDINRDGNFDANEKLTNNLSGKAEVTGNISFNVGEVVQTRMRVVMKYNAAPASACGDIGDGEVEDYTVLLHP